MVIVPLRELVVKNCINSHRDYTVLLPLPDVGLTLAQSRDSVTVQSVLEVTVIS